MYKTLSKAYKWRSSGVDALEPSLLKLLPVFFISKNIWTYWRGYVCYWTITVLWTSVAAFPAASETLYEIVYVPAVDVSTEPEIDIDEVMFPSTLSEAVAPGSVKVSPTLILIVEEPVNVITGAVVSAAALKITVCWTNSQLLNY